MTELDNNTEQKILEAANKVFVEKGFDGTRMQQIADEAKINKSLLHYYYRSKDKLFHHVKPEKITEIFSHLFDSFFNTALNNLEQELINEHNNGKIIKIELNEFIVNLLSLCIFPFVGRPIIKATLMNNSQKKFDDFIEKRKTDVAELVINSIKIK